MNKFLKDSIGKIDYNTYMKLHFGSIMSSIGINLIKNLFIPSDSFIMAPVSFVSMALTSVYIYSAVSNGGKYTKDVMEVKKLYYEFINNYNKLNKIFDFNDPVSVYTMYNYLLYKGYLSLDKKFAYDAGLYFNENVIPLGIGVTINNGCCRHISCMLTDILSNMGIIANNCGCFMVPFIIDNHFVDKSEYSREENFELIDKYVLNPVLNENLKNELYFFESINMYLKIDFSSFYAYDKKIKNKKNVTHGITISMYEGKSYFLDPTCGRIYHLKEGSNEILYDNDSNIIYLREHLFGEINDDKSRKQLRREYAEIFKYPCISFEEEKKLIGSSLDICSKNMDVFEKFYTDNCELYNEINAKMLKFKRKKI